MLSYSIPDAEAEKLKADNRSVRERNKKLQADCRELSKKLKVSVYEYCSVVARRPIHSD